MMIRCLDKHSPARHLLSILVFFLLLTAILFPAPGQAVAKAAPSIEQQYQQTKEYCNALRKDAKKAKSRGNWLKAVDSFKKIYDKNPDGHLAPASLFMIGRTYRDLFTWSAKPQDLDEAFAGYEGVVTLHPKSKLADDALLAMAKLALTDRRDPEYATRLLTRLLADYPQGDMAPDAAREMQGLKQTGAVAAVADPLPSTPAHEPLPKPTKKHRSKLLSLRSWSSVDYTRVVIETSEPVDFKHFLLDGTGDTVKRLVIDLDNCRIPPHHQSTIPVQDGLLKQVRSAQFSETSVRVVLDTQSLTDYKIFNLTEPFRVVVDVLGTKRRKKMSENGSIAKTANPAEPAIIKQLDLGIKTIILDPGHGGKDCGAISPNGLKEKDIALTVALKVAQILKKDHQYRVILTRSQDLFVPLEERTAIANSKLGDLFISIHVNSAPTAEAQGVETYFLNLTNSKEAMQVAARENATSADQLSDLQAILRDLLQNSKIHESASLAELVQDTMVAGLSKKYENVMNLGVKRAPFVVLIGAQMPAVLAEIAFLSNPGEEKRLMEEPYLVTIAEQLASGVSQYATRLEMAASLTMQ